MLRRLAPLLPASLAELAAIEAGLITAPDDELRFHSGPPRASSLSA